MSKKDQAFWYFFVPSLIIITLVISLSPWLLELAATPVNRVFSGINRWSTDYFIYLSYVELGKRGELAVRLLTTTMAQKPFFTHISYTLPGFILGRHLGFSSIFVYHFSRFIYGLIFLFLTVFFFYRLSKNKTISFVAFLFVFYIFGFVKINSLNPLRFSRYLDWFQEQNIIGRATGPLHYNLGFFFFILTFLWFFTIKSSFWKKSLIFGLLLNLTLFINPFSFLIMAFSFFIYWIVNICLNIRKLSSISQEFLVTLVGFLTSLPLLIYNQHYLSLPPWGTIGNSIKYYVVIHPPIYFWELILSIGPSFFLGIVGIIGYITRKIKTNLTRQQFIFLCSWLMVQFFLVFLGDLVRIDPLRSFNGLYYLPLSLFSALFIVSFFKNRKIIIVTVILLFLITIPNYYLSYKEQLFAFTDFKYFSLFTYPTKKQVETFRFLEKNTPVGSGVLAMFEGSSLIIGFSGNSTEFGLSHQEKLQFYTNQMSPNVAYQFLKKYRFNYVYLGYQERSAGGNIDQYSFLKKIFSNEETTIYKVL